MQHGITTRHRWRAAGALPFITTFYRAYPDLSSGSAHLPKMKLILKEALSPEQQCRTPGLDIVDICVVDTNLPPTSSLSI